MASVRGESYEAWVSYDSETHHVVLQGSDTYVDGQPAAESHEAVVRLRAHPATPEAFRGTR